MLTHAHFDHSAGVDTLVKKYHCPVYINELDIPLLTDPQLNFSIGDPIIVHTKAQVLTPGEHTIGKFTFDTLMHQVIAKAVVCYYGMIIYFVEMCCFR